MLGEIVLRLLPQSARAEEGELRTRHPQRRYLMHPDFSARMRHPIWRARWVVSKDLETVGFKMTREQAVDLARVLLAAAQEWCEVEITGFRLKKRKSVGTFPITVTGDAR